MVIGIINNINIDVCIDKDSIEKGCGGSETWLLQLSLQFIKFGHTVIIFSKTNEPIKNNLNQNELNILDIKYLYQYDIDTISFDFIIINREFSITLFDFVKKLKNKGTIIFYQKHDLYTSDKDGFDKTIKLIDKLICLTPYHLNFLKNYDKIDNTDIVIIPNGIDINLFKYKNNKRDNRILWCSNPDRGLYIICKLYNDIKKVIPDFGIDICYPNYSTLDNKLLKEKDIKILGTIDKDSLYKEMVKHKCWVYPQNFKDTFCIGAIENVMSDVNIVCPWWYGPGDIFPNTIIADNEKYKCYDNGFLKDFNNGAYAHLSKQLNIDIFNLLLNDIYNKIRLYDDPYFINKRKIMKEYVESHYRIENVALRYEDLYINTKLNIN